MKTFRAWQTCILAGAMAGLGVTACEGETGPMGPAGADGMDGDPGDPGEDGDDGEVGDVGPAGRTPLLRLLSSDLDGWVGDNRDRLNQLIQERGASSESFDPSQRPVAVFDWDNTVIKNDIGDATMFWLINHDKIRQPPNRDWSATNAHLTDEATAALSAACDGLAAPGQPLPTSSNTACADEIFTVYYDGETVAGDAAWDEDEVTSTINQPYAWVAQLLTGYSPSEVRSFAEAAFWQNTTAAHGQPQMVGSNEVTGWIKIYDQMVDLIGTLQDNGFDVWVVSASPQFVVEPAAAEVGIASHHVIGIRTVLDDDGLLTPDLQGCGDVADGDNTLITFDRGKRCWINKVIFHEAPENQLAQNADPAHRPVLVAGDSDTDIAMLKDATGLRIAINRNKPQIMCNAYSNLGDAWLVQPMFIDPKACREAPYSCAAGVDNDGDPMVDEAGNAMADQEDAVCEL